jgi:hypothetical protein
MTRRAPFLLLLIATGVFAADDPYAVWGHGRPQDAIAPLHRLATASGRWDAWHDLGLAAAAAGERGRAAAWLVEAHRLAPERREPLDALRALGSSPPAGWFDRLGPLAWPGCGWSGVILCGLGGLALGWALAEKRRRGAALALGLVACVAAAPGQLALLADARQPLTAVVRDSHLLDSAGKPGEAVAAGTIVAREPQPPWAGRVLVRLGDGRRGYLPLADTEADPPGGAGP